MPETRAGQLLPFGVASSMSKRILLLPLVILAMSLASASCLGSDLVATGSGAGDLVLRFSTSSVAGDFEGALVATGTLLIDGTPTRFRVEGPISGRGTVHLASLVIDAWVVVDALGETDDGKPFAVRGGFTVTRATASTGSDAIGSGAGQFDLRLVCPAFDVRVRGDIQGSASGSFVAPDDPFTMQISGDLVFGMQGQIVGDATGALPALSSEQMDPEDPLCVVSWPEDLAAELARLLADASLDQPT